jgi:hypothetical protein
MPTLTYRSNWMNILVQTNLELLDTEVGIYYKQKDMDVNFMNIQLYTKALIAALHFTVGSSIMSNTHTLK